MPKAKLTEEKSIEISQEKPEEISEENAGEISEKKSKVKESGVSKTVLKTGLLTALVFLLVLIFAFTITAFISPKFVSDLSLRLGANNLSAIFSVAQYNRTKDINDLATAVERSVSANRYGDVAEYGEILVNFESGNKDFKDFANFKDDSLNTYYKEAGIDAVSDYYNLIYGNYVYSLYKINEKDKAYDIAVLELDKFKDSGNNPVYTANNPLRSYIDAYIEDTNRSNAGLFSELGSMYSALNNLDEPSEEENFYKKIICMDLVRLYEALGNVKEAERWFEEYKGIK